MARDTLGNLHIAYVGDRIYYASQVGDRWEIEAIDDTAPAPVYGTHRAPPSLAIDGNNAPHIAYLSADNQAIIYATKNEAGWQKKVVESVRPLYTILYETAIALDQSGYPHIAYSHSSFPSSSLLRHAFLSEDGWQIETVDDRGWIEMYLSIEIDSKDRPHITYFTLTPSGARLMYAHKTPKGYAYIFIDQDPVFVGEFNSLALDANDHPHIAYLNFNNGMLRYAHWDGTNLFKEDLAVSPWWGGFFSIKVSKSEKPVISYTKYD